MPETSRGSSGPESTLGTRVAASQPPRQLREGETAPDPPAHTARHTMARCTYCGSTILFGGTRDGQYTYCNATCAGKGAMAAASRDVPEDAVRAEVNRIHGGACPKCGGPGPV